MRIPVMVDGELTVYRMWFQHKRNEISPRMKLSQPRHMGMGPHSSTRCCVERVEWNGRATDVGPMWFGEAVCSLSDQFEKEKGRKVALARAIKPLPREVRACIWAGYLYRAQLHAIDHIKWFPSRRVAMFKLKETQ